MQAIDRNTLQDMQNKHKDFVLINVLKPEHFQKAHINSSINIPLESRSFTKQVETVAGGKDRDVVVYCASFDCDASPKAAQKLEKAGFKHVYDYEGGTKDWLDS